MVLNTGVHVIQVRGANKGLPHLSETCFTLAYIRRQANSYIKVSIPPWRIATAEIPYINTRTCDFTIENVTPDKAEIIFNKSKKSQVTYGGIPTAMPEISSNVPWAIK